ncbi:hypothetical protein AYI69_g2628 [Smittium culicis]|uniref:Uncharacterized protein n=1 Tax=Smittium culicis TaxID=133412 RepID=A0A1R1YM68_9FUNG|nr:hypothetical protein AYI69_g2628 [Smittium culicis]
MSALLAEVAAAVAQKGLVNLHKGLQLPRKPTQLVESDFKPLMDQEELITSLQKNQQLKDSESCAFAGANRALSKRIRTKATLLWRKELMLQIPLNPFQIKKLAISGKIFAGEAEAAERGLNRDPECPTS